MLLIEAHMSDSKGATLMLEAKPKIKTLLGDKAVRGALNSSETKTA